MKPTAIDLFCGAGGLTLGLKKAGFKVVVGVEINPEIAKTYKANHRRTKLLIKDIREVTGKEIFELAGVGEIDMVAGCPPCQGFSKLTDKYRRKDPRNDLVLEMARIVEEIEPKMVMMENVAGLATRGKRILYKFVERLRKRRYLVSSDILQMADYGIPQSRKRLVVLAGKRFEIPLPNPTHCKNGDAEKGLKPWLTLADVIKGMPKPINLSEVADSESPIDHNWHVVSDLTTLSKERLGALNAGENRRILPKHLRPKCHKNRDKGFINVYGRLSWDQTSPTITSGFNRPCMGRYGHPDEIRTISPREAALIQTFPMDYKFKTEYMSTACNLVGNALPYVFARKVAVTCLKSYRKKYPSKKSIRQYRISGSVFHARI